MEENGVESPDQREQFAEVLKSHKVKPSEVENISRYIADSSQGAVFEIPQELSDKLAEFHDQVDPARRKRIITHWFAKQGVQVPYEVLKGIVPVGERGESEREQEMRRGMGEGRVWFVDTDRSAERGIFLKHKNRRVCPWVRLRGRRVLPLLQL